MYVKEIMTRDVITINEENSVEECAKLLLENELTGMPVVDAEDKLTGIVTEGDLIKRASRIKMPAVLELLGGFIYLESPGKYMDELKRAMSIKVADMMSKNVVTVKADDTVEQAATLMMKKKIKRLPVVDEEGRVEGIVSRRDIMSHLYWK